MKITNIILSRVVLAAMLMPGITPGAQTPSAKTDSKVADKNAPAAAAPTPQQIADARSKGLVWVNTSTKVYHKDGQFYGNTKRGRFMAEADAQKAGFKAAQESGTTTKKAAKSATK